MAKGRWHDFRVRVVWEYRDNSVGRVEVDHKLHTQSSYSRVFNYIGPNMYNAEGYLKWGIYNPDWTTIDTGVPLRAIWHDNLKIGSSWSEVDPTY